MCFAWTHDRHRRKTHQMPHNGALHEESGVTVIGRVERGGVHPVLGR